MIMSDALKQLKKQLRKEWKAEIIRRNGFVGNNGKVTIACIPTFGKNGKFAVAVCSEDDKFKRKEGEYIAMRRIFEEDSGQPCTFPRTDEEIFDFIINICDAISPPYYITYNAEDCYTITIGEQYGP